MNDEEFDDQVDDVASKIRRSGATAVIFAAKIDDHVCIVGKGDDNGLMVSLLFDINSAVSEKVSESIFLANPSPEKGGPDTMAKKPVKPKKSPKPKK